MKNYKGEVQYVRYYTAGNAAPKLAAKPVSHTPTKVFRKEPKPVRRIRLLIDPYALVGTAVAVVMVLFILAGCFQVDRANRTVAAMETHISAVKAENAALAEAYEQGYDIEEIKTAAAAMGLIPVEDAEHIRIHVAEPVTPPEPGFWEELWAELRELFA